MSSALDAVPGGVLSLSSDLRILAANRAMGALVGRSSDELVGEPFDVLLSAPSRILFQTHVHPALKADGSVEEVFLKLASATGDTVPVLLNAARSGAGDDARYEAAIVRIRARARWETELLAATRALERERTESRRLAEELAARHEEEQRIREFRDAFIGVLSHELRTPITTIYGMSQVLLRRHRSMPPETVERHLADIDEEAHRLRRLTEDLLVLSQAEGGRLAVVTEPTLLARVVTAAVDSERTRWPAHAFEVTAPPGPALVEADAGHVEQVVRNYLSNAAKYSPPGSTIRVTLTPESGGVAVRVIDEGPGLPDAAPERLFDLFYRAPDAMKHAAGAGIGLFVCRELIGAMGGRVWAAPAPATTGAEFGFWLPAAQDDALATG